MSNLLFAAPSPRRIADDKIEPLRFVAFPNLGHRQEIALPDHWNLHLATSTLFESEEIRQFAGVALLNIGANVVGFELVEERQVNAEAGDTTGGRILVNTAQIGEDGTKGLVFFGIRSGGRFKSFMGISASACVNSELGIALLEIEQSKGDGGFRTNSLTKKLAEALKRLEESTSTSSGSIKYIRDETWFFDGPRIYIAKPALRGRWTRTAALNDAAEVHATIQFSRKSKA